MEVQFNMGWKDISWEDYYEAWARVAYDFIHNEWSLPMRPEVVSHAVSQMFVGAFRYILTDSGYDVNKSFDPIELINNASTEWEHNEHLDALQIYSVELTAWNGHDPEVVGDNGYLMLKHAVDVFGHVLSLVKDYKCSRVVNSDKDSIKDASVDTFQLAAKTMSDSK